jgi:regulator of cell morphogenesis and NO signaling
MEPDSRTTVREIVLEFPQAAGVFESLGIDYCCGGKQTLDEACRQAGVTVETVRTKLQQSANPAEMGDERWTIADLSELTEHIVQQHHVFVRRESTRLMELLQKVQAVHAASHPELHQIGNLFGELTSELVHHMLKEERVLFPLIKELESGGQTALCGVEFPIRRMIAEHAGAGESLAGIRLLSGEFEPPADACLSFRALYQGLEAFERDLHRHIHLENNILFPRALALAGLSGEVETVG